MVVKPLVALRIRAVYSKAECRVRLDIFCWKGPLEESNKDRTDGNSTAHDN
ncbi:hypothetical protein C7476_113146 [Phyllobacterium bourgognense]|uniref:Uncharacterized protein n=1 Tax=Phyllobacterium bourgognense TaxID=314236 RepID=A0A368YKA6_9HYPH|nr:hypothetical protein C7476_113146 [Phyllobacterium bourgognense]